MKQKKYLKKQIKNRLQFNQVQKNLFLHIKNKKFTKGKESLTKFSNWLHDFSGQDHIEIPGQYNEDIEPFVESHTTITSFEKNVLIL